MKDFSISAHGNIVLLHGHTKAAADWIAEHLPSDVQRFGLATVVVESRYIADIVHGARGDGLVVSA